VRNPSFDVTPADLVTGLITEQGVIFDPDENKIARLFIDA
jgi:methylthioribose-1-phosphate isomerase